MLKFLENVKSVMFLFIICIICLIYFQNDIYRLTVIDKNSLKDDFSTKISGKPFKNVMKTDEVIHIASIIFGEKFFSYGYTSLKSIILTTKRSLNFYIVTNDDTVDKIHAEMKSWPKEVLDRVNVYQIDFNYSDWQAVLTGKNMMKGLTIKFRSYGSLFNSRLISEQTSKLIYMDADFLSLTDIGELWDVFHQFKPKQTLATTTGARYLQQNYLVYNRTFINNNLGINAGLIMFDMAKLKALSFLNLLEQCTRLPQKALKIYDDQDLLTLYIEQHLEQYLLLPCSWNVRQSMSKCDDEVRPELRCKAAEKFGLHLLHATHLNFLAKGQYSNVYNCMASLDFNRMSDTAVCLRHAIEHFKEEEKVCKNKKHFLNNLEKVLQLHSFES